MKRLFRPEILAAAILLTTALTVQAAPTMPSQQSGPAAPTASTSPGEAFLPPKEPGRQIGAGSQSATGAREIYPCEVYFDEEGHAHMDFGNASTTDFPIGTKVIFIFSNGEVEWTIFSLYPFNSGTDWHSALQWKYKPPLDCTIQVEPPEEDMPH